LSEALSVHRAGNLPRAEALYRRILRIDPGDVDAWHLLGVARHQQRDHAGAREHIQRAIDLGGRSAPMYGNLGSVLRELGRLAEAEQHLRQAVELATDTAGFHYNLGNCLRDQGRFLEAAAAYREAIARDPHSAGAFNNLGDVLRSAGQLAGAEAAFQAALRIRPKFAEAAFHLAGLYRAQERLEDAVAAGRRAVQARPDYVDAWVNLGYTLEDLGRIDEAVEAYDAALRHDPQSVEAHFNRALAWLRAGDFARGWDEYEWRLRKGQGGRGWSDQRERSPGDRAADARRGFPSVQPRPPVATFDSITVLGEQGIGDEVMFASCLGEILSHTRRCTATCDPRLRPLFARSFPEIEFHSRLAEPGDLTNPRVLNADVSETSFAIPLGSLPRFLRRDAASFPSHSGYLTPHPGLFAEWRRRYAAIGSAVVVGISWRGGRDSVVRRRRSIPPADWACLLETPGVRFVNLQYGVTRDELAAFETAATGKLHHWDDCDPLVDLDGFAAQIAALDLVISADNATVHLAGALGKPVWTLLPAACDWRWGIAGNRTPWYPSTTLFRQTTNGDWPGVMRRVASRLLEQGCPCRR
jgi:tetratricopeptide (TPR) repeat protein